MLIVLFAFGLVMAIQARRLATERDSTARERDRAEQVSAFSSACFRARIPTERRESLTARDLLDRGVQRLQAELKDQPRTRATLLHAIGGVYRALGRYEDARSVFEEALSLRRNLKGRERADLADTEHELGHIYEAVGDNPRQEAMYREALQIRRDVFGPEHIKIAQSIACLGQRCVPRQGRFLSRRTVLSCGARDSQACRRSVGWKRLK